MLGARAPRPPWVNGTYFPSDSIERRRVARNAGGRPRSQQKIGSLPKLKKKLTNHHYSVYLQISLATTRAPWLTAARPAPGNVVSPTRKRFGKIVRWVKEFGPNTSSD